MVTRSGLIGFFFFAISLGTHIWIFCSKISHRSFSLNCLRTLFWTNYWYFWARIAAYAVTLSYHRYIFAVLHDLLSNILYAGTFQISKPTLFNQLQHLPIYTCHLKTLLISIRDVHLMGITLLRSNISHSSSVLKDLVLIACLGAIQ